MKNKNKLSMDLKMNISYYTIHYTIPVTLLLRLVKDDLTFKLKII